MRTIHKYTLEHEGRQTLPLPRDSRVLSVMEQNNDIVLYAEAEQAQLQTELHTVHIYGTGFPLEHNGGGCKFVGTVKLGAYVFHVYHQAPTQV